MPPVEQDALIYGPIRVELLTHKVLAQGKFVRLAKMEYRLLCYLILHEGQVLSRQEILTKAFHGVGGDRVSGIREILRQCCYVPSVCKPVLLCKLHRKSRL